jgi:hypothetical protein
MPAQLPESPRRDLEGWVDSPPLSYIHQPGV